MADFRLKNLKSADESMEFPLVSVDAVDLGEMTVARAVTEPGWRWSTHMKPMVGGEWCMARHIGVVVSGSMGVTFSDGTEIVCGPDDVFDIPPEHDGYVLGDEPLVTVEWSGHRTFVRNIAGSRERILTTLLFTDFVGSTELVARLGDHAWRELTVEQFQEARAALDRFGGREVNTTGDGMLAMFDGPAAALRCAASIRAAAERAGLKIRAGVHIGEVELVGSDVRGLAVHVAARIMGAAEPNEVLVSETTRALSLAAGMQFEDRGAVPLKGLEGEHRLYAVLG